MSPQPEKAASSPAEFSAEERTTLLRLAHASIESALNREAIFLEPPSAHLAEPRGAFTTIYVEGELHGCVGYVIPVASLYRTVAETARGAAFEDSRFPPITSRDLPTLEASLSILSPLQPIRAEEVEVGRHGLLISQYGHRGLLLPQVAVEHNWDRETFLGQTCRKAGLPEDAWKGGAKIEAFSAEVFGEANRT